VTSTLRTDATALAAVTDMLAPAHAGGPARPYAVLPRRSRPRYVLPTSGRHAAGVALRPGRGPAADAARLVVSSALRLGAGRLLPGGLRVADGTDDDPSLRRHLATVLGEDGIDLAVALGAPRPNRKPVIQVIGPDGSTRAWVKVGVDAHTDELVAHETDALRGHRPGAPVVAPDVLAAGAWHGHRLLALAPLAVTETGDDLDLTPDVVRAVAGPLHPERVVDGRWWKALTAVADDPGSDPEGRVAAGLDRLAPALGDRIWPFGAWHGDLAPWNATWEGDRLHVWDWERADRPVPLGLDLVHNRFMVAMLRDGADLAGAVAAVRSREAATFVALGYDDDDVALVIAAYLLTIRARYAGDARFGALGAAGPVAAAIDADPTLGGTVTP
jgi:hypothetical protein